MIFHKGAITATRTAAMFASAIDTDAGARAAAINMARLDQEA